MSTRQVASLLAAAAPEVLPPRDTLRAAAPDRYTLKVSIDQECEQGLRLLKDLMSHVDPRMSWGDLVARLVRDAVARHDPRGGGSGQRRRRSAGSAGVSPRRAPKETRAAGPAGGPAQRGGESSPRTPNKTRAAGAAGGPAQRGGESSPRTPNKTHAAGEAAEPAQRVDESSAHRRRYSGATGRHRRYRKAEPDRGAGQRCSTESVRARRAFGWRPYRWRSIGRARRYFGAEVRVRRLGGWLPCRHRRAGRARRYFGAGAGTRRVPWRRTERRVSRSSGRRLGGWLFCAGRRAGLAGRHCGGGADTRRVPRRRTARRISRSSGAHDPRTCSPPPPIPAAALHSRGGPAPHLATRRWTLLLSRSALRAALHLVPSAADRPPVASRRGRWPGAVQPQSPVRSSSPNAPRLRTGCSAGAPDVVPPPRCRRATRLRWPTACKWPGGDTLRSPASSACIFATASSDPGRSLSMRSRNGVVVVSRQRFLPLPAFVPPQPPAARGALNSRCNSDSRSGSRIATGLAAHDVPVAGRELHATRGGSEGAKGGGHRASGVPPRRLPC